MDLNNGLLSSYSAVEVIKIGLLKVLPVLDHQKV